MRCIDVLHRQRSEERKAEDDARHDGAKRLELTAVRQPVAADRQIRSGEPGGQHDARRADKHRLKGHQRRARRRQREAEGSDRQQPEQQAPGFGLHIPL